MLFSIQQGVDTAQENLDELIPEEKTLSIYDLIMDGGLGGQIIIAILVVLLAVALYIYFERYLAIKAGIHLLGALTLLTALLTLEYIMRKLLHLQES